SSRCRSRTGYRSMAARYFRKPPSTVASNITRSHRPRRSDLEGPCIGPARPGGRVLRSLRATEPHGSAGTVDVPVSREPDAAAASSTDRGLLPERSACVGAALIAAGFAGLFIVGSRDFPLDDAWIHLAYAKSLRLGDGLSYNPGDWETGASSPLWVL